MNETQYKYFVSYAYLEKKKKRPGFGSCVISTNNIASKSVLSALEEHIKQDINASDIAIISFIELKEEKTE